jgi:hypothetical protein
MHESLEFCTTRQPTVEPQSTNALPQHFEPAPGRLLLFRNCKFIMLEGGGLHPTSKGARVRFSGKDREITRGPFGNTSGLVSGYWIWKVSSLDEAIEWIKRCPNPMPEASEIEVRPL